MSHQMLPRELRPGGLRRDSHTSDIFARPEGPLPADDSHGARSGPHLREHANG